MKYRRFEELPVWKMARELCKDVWQLINETGLKHDFSRKDQIWRSAGSVMDNIAEGFDDDSPKEFIRFLGYSQRSCSELQSQLYRSLDCSYITESQFDTIYTKAGECRKQIRGFRKYLRNYSKTL